MNRKKSGKPDSAALPEVETRESFSESREQSRPQMERSSSPATAVASSTGTSERQKNISLESEVIAEAMTRLHAELDEIVTRPLDDVTCREQLLDCVLRQRSLVAGVWQVRSALGAEIEISRLRGPLFERDDIRKWINQVGMQALTQQKTMIVKSRMVRNLVAVSVPVQINQRGADRKQQIGMNPAETSPSQSGRVLTLLLTDTRETSRGETEALAAQCVIRTWRDWISLHQARDANERTQATSALLDLSGRISHAESLPQACQILTNSLQQHFSCRFAAVGLIRNGRATANLMTISGLGDFDSSSQQTRKITSALNEAVVRGFSTSWPELNPSQDYQNLAHKRLAESMGVESVVSVPLKDDQGEIIGSLTLGGTGQQLLGEQTLRVIQACSSPLGTALSTARQIEGGVLRRTARRVRKAATKWRLLFFGLLGIAIGTIMMMPASYQIHCRAEAQPVLRRYSLAPYDGLLENTFVEPGDVVREGTLLAQMDGRELSWELAGVTAEAHKAEKEKDSHLVSYEIAQSLMAKLEMEKLSARDRVLRYRLENLEIRSPVNGIVLSGSLEKRQNYPVTIGQTLYEIAPLDPIRMEVAVPAEELPHVRPGLTVQIRIDGEGGEVIEGSISKIRPRSEIRNERNVFIAEVNIPNRDGHLRPGMEGAARITGDTHPLVWNVCHRAWEKLGTTLWW